MELFLLCVHLKTGQKYIAFATQKSVELVCDNNPQ